MKRRHSLCLLGLVPSLALAWVTNQTCFDDCLRQDEPQLLCLSQCSTEEPAPGKAKSPLTPKMNRPASTRGLPETDMLGEMMAQAEAACKVGNKQACFNLKQMRAGQ